MAEKFFNPETIAIIGSTEDPTKFGNTITINLLKNPLLKSKIFPVSKTSKSIYGLPVYPTVLDIPDKIDLGLIVVPAKVVPAVVDECIIKKIPSIIIITAGFSEIDEEGKSTEQLIKQKCHAANLRVIGPNCVGIQNTEIYLNASFIQTPFHGDVSFITQSGSFGCAILDGLKQANVGISKFANIGNAIDISFDDVLSYYNRDPQTKIIALYIESITKGRAFYKEILTAAQTKPVIVLNGGHTKVGKIAAESHTGAMISDNRILNSVVKQAGGVMCEQIHDYITAITTFSKVPLPKGENIVIFTNSGATGVLVCDNLENMGLGLATFSKHLIEKISPHVIPLVQKVNPLDMIASANEETYYQITKAMLEEDSGIDIVVGCGVNPPFLGMTMLKMFQGMVKAWNESGRKKPLIPLLMFGHLYEGISDFASQSKTAFFSDPYDTAYAIKLLINRVRYLNRIQY